jgi:transcriptional regulator with AAA-type ATPase domain
LAAGLWIVHRDPRWREALRRLVGGAPLVADPGEPGALADAPAPRAVLLGASGDFEAELAWAHGTAARLARESAAHGAPSPSWLILAEPRDVDEARRLFDALPGEVVPVSSDSRELRRRLRVALARRGGAALSERSRRDALSARFERWLGDLDAAALLAAIDPGRRQLPLLVRGEGGTGRGLLARTLHLQAGLGGAAPGAFASVTGAPGLDAGELLAGLVPELTGVGAAGALTVCVEDADALDAATQRRLAGWIEDGPPAGTLPATRLRWMATAGDPAADDDRLEPALASALAGLVVRIPPLRERPAAVDRIAADTLRTWGALRAAGGPAPQLADDAIAALHTHAWPGNARELEAVVRRTLATATRDPIPAKELVFDALLPAPPDAASERPSRERGERAAKPERVEPVPPAVVTDTRGAPAAGAAEPAPSEPLRRLAGAVAHEVGNPLVGIRTFAQMLPSRFDDPEFRAQFSERVEADTRRIEAVVETLARLGSLPAPGREPVDVSALLARLLQLQGARIQERRLVVLEELDREHPFALGDAEQLRFALGMLLEETLSWLPEHGDLYLATRHHSGASAPGEPDTEAAQDRGRLRILLRSRGGAAGAPDLGLRLTENTLAVAAVEAVVRAHRGSLAVEPGEPGETLVLIELPAP